MYRSIVLPQLKRAPLRTALYMILLAIAVAFFALSLNLYHNSACNIQTTENAFSTIAVPELWTNVDKDGTPVDITHPDSVGKHAVPVTDLDLKTLSTLPGVSSVDLRWMLATYIPDHFGRMPLENISYDLIRFSIQGSSPVSVGSLTRNIRLNVTKSAAGFISYASTPVLTHAFYRDSERQLLERFNQCIGEDLILRPGVEYVAFVKVYHRGRLSNGQVAVDTICFQSDLYGIEAYKRYIPFSAEAGTGGRAYSVYNHRTQPEQPFGICHAADVDSDPKLSAYFEAAAQACRISNYSFAVTTTNSLESIPLFHQQQAYINQGRSFTAKEYAGGSKVCIVPRDLAEVQGWKIGDSIGMYFYQYGGFMDVPPFSDEFGYGWSPFYEKGNGGIFAQNQYTIVGFWDFSPQSHPIISLDVRTTTIQQGMIFVPTASVENLPATAPATGSRLTVHLQNGMSEEFLAALAKLELTKAEMNVTILDQGYADAQFSLQSMLGTSQLLLTLSSVLLVTVIALAAFFFVHSQKRTMALMRLLGARPYQAAFAVLLCTLLLLPGTIFGAFTGHHLTNAIARHILYGNAVPEEYLGFREAFGVQAEPVFALSAQTDITLLALAVGASLFLVLTVLFTATYIGKEPRQLLPEDRG